MSHGKTPSRLLTLAQAYRASGQMEKSRATAKEGLALLPALPAGKREAEHPQAARKRSADPLLNNCRPFALSPR